MVVWKDEKAEKIKKNGKIGSASWKQRKGEAFAEFWSATELL